MNDKNTQENTPTEHPRGEKIASGIMKTLAIVGLVAALTLVAWLAVQLVRTIPNAGDRLQGAVVAVQSIFRNNAEEGIAFVLESRTVPANEEYRVSFEYTGETPPEDYVFSFSCADNVTMEVESDSGWETLACDVPFPIAATSFAVIPHSDNNRFIDVTLSIQGRSTELSDTTLITIVNENVADSRSALFGSTTDETKGTSGADTDTDADTGATSGADTGATSGADPDITETPKPASGAAPTPTVVTPIRTPIARGPSDLAVNIKATGIVAPVKGVNVLFPISPIPSDKTAGVTFTVTNQGGEASGAWAFVAHLPIEGDPTYKYTSPAQSSLPAGAQVEFTLGFDEVLERSSGTIKLELVPTKTGDRTANNIDQVSIKIRN